MKTTFNCSYIQFSATPITVYTPFFHLYIIDKYKKGIKMTEEKINVKNTDLYNLFKKEEKLKYDTIIDGEYLKILEKDQEDLKEEIDTINKHEEELRLEKEKLDSLKKQKTIQFTQKSKLIKDLEDSIKYKKDEKRNDDALKNYFRHHTIEKCYREIELLVLNTNIGFNDVINLISILMQKAEDNIDGNKEGFTIIRYFGDGNPLKKLKGYALGKRITGRDIIYKGWTPFTEQEKKEKFKVYMSNHQPQILKAIHDIAEESSL